MGDSDHDRSNFVRRSERAQKLPVRLINGVTKHDNEQSHIDNDTPVESPAKKIKLEEPENLRSNTFHPPISLRRKKTKVPNSNTSVEQDPPITVDKIITPSNNVCTTSSTQLDITPTISSSSGIPDEIPTVPQLTSHVESNLSSNTGVTIPADPSPAKDPINSIKLKQNVTPSSTSDTQQHDTQQISEDNLGSQDDDQIDCSIDDLVPTASKDSENDLDYDNVLETVKHKADRKAQLLKHLAGVIQQRKDMDMKDNKLLLPNIASNFERTELRVFLTNHFQSIKDEKVKRKRAAKPKAEPETVNYVNEISMMMHAFGDVAKAEIESAKYLNFIIKRYITTLVNNIKEVLPHHPTKPYKVNAEVLYVALLPDLKKIYRVQQAIRHLIQTRALKRTEKTADTNNNNNANDTDIAHGTSTVPQLENILEQVALPSASVASSSKPDEAASVLFDTPYWRARMVPVGQQAEAEKLERHQWKDRLSQQVGTGEFGHFMQCTSASFTKPHRKKLVDFMKVHCGLGSLETTGKVVEMIGLLTYDMLMELVMGALQRKMSLKLGSGPLAPIDIYGFMENLKKTGPTTTANNTNSNNNNNNTTTNTTTNTNANNGVK